VSRQVTVNVNSPVGPGVSQQPDLWPSSEGNTQQLCWLTERFWWPAVINGAPVLSIQELYDPDTGQFSSSGENTLTRQRSGHTATLLRDGRVLIAGGSNLSTVLSSLEAYDPNSGYFTVVATMIEGRLGHTATLLQDGKVLITGGRGDSIMNSLASAEIFNPHTSTSTPTDSMATARQNHAATLLPNGQVLITGGESGTDGPSPRSCMIR